jgi:hypothetical protein
VFLTHLKKRQLSLDRINNTITNFEGANMPISSSAIVIGLPDLQLNILQLLAGVWGRKKV